MEGKYPSEVKSLLYSEEGFETIHQIQTQNWEHC